ncbi:hypothetical protein ACFE04_014117 [Oxalis oulophora]
MSSLTCDCYDFILALMFVAHERPHEQNLFGIVQGGFDPILSYATGSLAGGEDKDSFWRVVAQCTAALPEDKPRYVMDAMGFQLLSYHNVYYLVKVRMQLSEENGTSI